MNNSFLNLVGLQFKEFWREPEVLFWALIFPVVLSGILGLAFANQSSGPSPIAVIRNANAPNHPALAALRQSEADSLPAFALRELPADSAFLGLKRGETALVLEPLPGGRLRYHFDPAHTEAQTQYLQLERKLTGNPSNRSEVRTVQTPGSRYIDFLIPGMLALGVMNSLIWGIAWNLIELRIKKLLRRMVATPMKRAGFLLTQLATRLILSAFEGLVLLGFAMLFFGVRVQGSWAVLGLAFLAGNVAFGGIAVLAAARPTKTQVGSAITNFITLSMTVLSGVFFSYTRFPDWLANFIQYLPLSLLADSMRAIINEGAGLVQVGGALVGLVITGVVCFFLGKWWFRWY